MHRKFVLQDTQYELNGGNMVVAAAPVGQVNPMLSLFRAAARAPFLASALPVRVIARLP